MNSAAILQAINIMLAGLKLVESLGINYQEVIDAQKNAEAEGRRKLNRAERRVFIDQAQSAIDKL